MRSLYALNAYRVKGRKVIEAFGTEGDDKGGMFIVPVEGVELRVIASSDAGWDHVSVAPLNEARCPTWGEMDAIKRLFFLRDETAMQLHVPELEHINDHPYCLHMWRPIRGVIHRPPGWMVGGPAAREQERAALEQALADTMRVRLADTMRVRRGPDDLDQTSEA